MLTANNHSSDESESEEEVAEEEAESEVEEEEEEEEEVDEEAQKRRDAYMSLMKSFETRSSGPAAKRRKLDHQAEHANFDSDEEEDGGDDDDVKESSGSASDELEEGGGSDEEEAEPKDVDAADDDEDIEEEIEIGGDDDEQLDTTDPFESHFSAPDLKDVSLRLISIKEEDWLTSKVSAQGSREIFTVPQTGLSSDFSPPAAVSSPHQLKLKKRLAEVNTKPFRPAEQKVAPLLFNYYDTLFCERTPDNGDELRRMASLHAVNHILK